MMKESLKIETEKEMIKRKVSNFKTTLSKDSFSSMPKCKSTVAIEKSRSPGNPNTIEKTKASKPPARLENSSSPRKNAYTAEYLSKNDEPINQEFPITPKNLNITKKYSMESDDEVENNLASIDNNFLNDINSDVEHNAVK
jgi:hypothetical protein